MPTPDPTPPPAVRTIDVHVHLAGVGTGGSGCHVSGKMRRSLVFGILRRVLRLDPDDPRTDDLYADRLASLVEGSVHVERAVLLAMDGVYDDAGRVDLEKSHLIVPNEYLLAVCRRHPQLLPGVSINPARRDAIDELERCAARGAVLVKWLPPLQHFDPADRRFLPFYRAMARLKVPLLGHTGCEHTFPEMIHEYGRPMGYRTALDEGVITVFAHCGVACRIHHRYHFLDEAIDLVARYPNAYADTSALLSLLKFHHLKAIPFGRLPGRFVHGSDYPIPPLAIPFVRTLGLWRSLALSMHPNALEVDWQVKAAVGVPDHVFEAPARVLGDRIALWDALRTKLDGPAHVGHAPSLGTSGRP